MNGCNGGRRAGGLSHQGRRVGTLCPIAGSCWWLPPIAADCQMVFALPPALLHLPHSQGRGVQAGASVRRLRRWPAWVFKTWGQVRPPWRHSHPGCQTALAGRRSFVCKRLGDGRQRACELKDREEQPFQPHRRALEGLLLTNFQLTGALSAITETLANTICSAWQARLWKNTIGARRRRGAPAGRLHRWESFARSRGWRTPGPAGMLPNGLPRWQAAHLRRLYGCMPLQPGHLLGVHVCRQQCTCTWKGGKLLPMDRASDMQSKGPQGQVDA